MLAAKMLFSSVSRILLVCQVTKLPPVVNWSSQSLIFMVYKLTVVMAPGGRTGGHGCPGSSVTVLIFRLCWVTGLTWESPQGRACFAHSDYSFCLSDNLSWQWQ